MKIIEAVYAKLDNGQWVKSKAEIIMESETDFSALLWNDGSALIELENDDCLLSFELSKEQVEMLKAFFNENN